MEKIFGGARLLKQTSHQTDSFLGDSLCSWMALEDIFIQLSNKQVLKMTSS